ncbi:MAG TPA: hypothetical protein VFW40_04785 [Capsulimonadaceae bacterium]|nr:hypothetical protein [Capsulimonadaceae bacterium]
MVSFKERLRKAQAEIAQHSVDPLRRLVEANVRGQNAIGTAPLLDLLGLPKTTANGRRLAQTMRSLGFVPIKSRRLLPGGYTDTVTRGWARPIKVARSSGSTHKTQAASDGS